MKVFWEKWNDPLDPNQPEQSPDEYEAVRQEFNDEERRHYIGPFIQTSMGIIGLDRINLACRNMRVWLGRCTQEPTKVSIDAAREVHGVEWLKRLTRYNFLLAVGLQFDEETVKKKVEDVLSGASPENPDRIEVMAKGCSLYWPAWAVLQGPDGQLEAVNANNATGLRERIAAYGELWTVVKYGLQ